MKRIDLEIVHKYKDQTLGYYRLTPQQGLVSLGKNADCGVRLLGDNVNDLHAVLEFHEGKWLLTDLGSQSGTWVGQESILAQEISDKTKVRVGGHSLEIKPITMDFELFAQTGNFAKPAAGQPADWHQIVLKRDSVVVGSYLIPKDEVFKQKIGKQIFTFSPPKSTDWNVKEVEGITVLRRLTTNNSQDMNWKESVKHIWDPELKAPFIVAGLVMLMLTALVVMVPQEPEKIAELEPPKRSSNLVYSKKAAQKKRSVAKASPKKAPKVAPKPAGKPKAKPKTKVAKATPKIRKSKTSSARKSVAKKTAAKPAKVVSKFKASGLSQLVGKISKRAAKNANFIQAKGVRARPGAGRALASVGSLGKVAATSGKTFQVGGVSTSGKAGGSGGYKGLGGLSAGTAGRGSVGILEEETEVKGGLDKDIISRYIESQLGQIRYCYERQLSANPSLYGKIKVKFTIGSSGSVSAKKIGSTTLNSAMVEGCILRRVAGWRFPKPSGGTKVLVTYPFLFKSTN